MLAAHASSVMVGNESGGKVGESGGEVLVDPADPVLLVRLIRPPNEPSIILMYVCMYNSQMLLCS